MTIGQTLQINELYFAANSSEITDESSTVLNEIYEFLIANNDVQIEIGGHTNSVPSDEFCDKLSGDRAKNVADYLYGKGIPKDQITYKGYGKRLPIASNETLAGRQKNQRVEIKIITFKQG
ncbi:MAG: OmpA family protein [Saprospiraceae bacterium]|nr:OmpA family protein [Saprospiraceae bacterium]